MSESCLIVIETIMDVLPKIVQEHTNYKVNTKGNFKTYPLLGTEVFKSTYISRHVEKTL